MKPIRLKYLWEDIDRHGNVRLYVVRGRGARKIRIHAAPGTPDFWAAYRAALDGRGAGEADAPGLPAPAVPAAPQSLRWLCQRYYASAEFKQLGERTRYVRRNILDRICRGNEGRDGNKPYRLLEARDIRAGRDALCGRPEAANAIIKALRQLYGWAIDAELAERNPARDVPYLKGNPDGFHTWSIEEVRQYEARHPLGSKARLALALLLFTGVRRSDVVRLGRQMVRDGWLHFTEIKGADRKVKERDIPILHELQAAIDTMPRKPEPRAEAMTAMTFLVTEFGKPFTANGFGNWFRKRCNEAGLPHCAAHGLRKAGATIAADNGATEHQLMAIYGWESPKQAALYTRKANRRKLAGAAMHLLVPEPESTGDETINRPLTNAR